MVDQVVVSSIGKTLHIRMNRPEKKNALTRAMYYALADAVERADADPAVRVIAITGTGDAFTSGNDLADFLDRQSSSNAERPAMHFLATIAKAKKPLLAGVNGLAVGIGVTMLLHCDLVYAATEATFALPFINLGLVPEAASSLLLPQMIGYHRAAELFFLGNRFDAQTAREIGLVNAVHPKEALDAAVQEVATALAAKPPASLRMIKELLKGQAFDAAVAARFEQETTVFERQLQSPEAREAVEAILQKRTPDFSQFN